MVVLGRVIAPYGVQGWVKLFPLGDDPLAWRKMPALWLGVDPDGTDWQRRELEGLKAHGKGLVAKFKGVDDRSAAEAIDGSYIAAPREALPATGQDEYYWADLIGLDVVNAQGVRLGQVAELIETGASDVLVVRDGEGEAMRERLLPFVAQVVSEVDVPKRLIRVVWEADW
jgi:16S rRNA processing protein RimM